MSGVGSFSTVSTRYGNGPSRTTKGFDIQASYGLPIGPGDLDVNVTATRVTELKTGSTTLDGVTVSTGDNRLKTLEGHWLPLPAGVAMARPERSHEPPA